MLRDILLFYEEKIGPSSWKLSGIPNPTALSRLESEIKTRLSACMTKLQPVLEKGISTAGYGDEKATEEELDEEATEEELGVVDAEEKLDEVDAKTEVDPEENLEEAAADEEHTELFNLGSQWRLTSGIKEDKGILKVTYTVEGESLSVFLRFVSKFEWRFGKTGNDAVISQPQSGIRELSPPLKYQIFCCVEDKIDAKKI